MADINLILWSEFYFLSSSSRARIWRGEEYAQEDISLVRYIKLIYMQEVIKLQFIG